MDTQLSQHLEPPASEAPKSTTDASGTENKPADDAPAVRFSSAVEEIAAPAHASPPGAGVDPKNLDDEDETARAADEVAADELKEFTKSLHGRTLLQERRMNTFQFEPVSLPASRVPSREDDSPASRVTTPGSSGIRQSPHGSPRIAAMTSPPLTPSGSDPLGTERRGSVKESGSGNLNPVEPQAITPQASTSHEKSPQPQYAQRQPLTHRPASSDHVLQRQISDDRHGDLRSHRRGMMGGGASVPVSRETSPSRSAASNYYSKPLTPGGDANDPYAKGRRPAQQPHSNRHSIDPRFVFSRKKKKQTSPSSSRTSLAEKRGSGIFGSKAGDDSSAKDASPSAHQHHGSSGSMSDLKRFFKGGHSKKRDSSPAARSGTKTPPSRGVAASRSTQQLPFGEDHGLSTKYGKIGRVLGSGAGGAVRLMKRKEDDTVFAVKEFRPKHTYETEKEYNKKVTAEFCVGSTLHHGNIIETLDIVREKGSWYEVMEYAPFDLFATVMTGKMARAEIRCCFLQILNGVTYLHSLGLAHRDLKLDNVVINNKGIMKIIDFGSAHVFKYPFENGIVMAKGIVGSDPYLAPEVYTAKEYDASAADIWSLAIIFCCMTLRRFPWKLPQMTDNSWKLFAAEPTPGHDPAKLVHSSRKTDEQAEKPSEDGASHKSSHHHDDSHSHSHHKRGESTATVAAEGASKEQSQSSQEQGQQPEKKEVIKGPWRILRLLPRESRYIIWRMLDVNPKTRATMDEILAEPWVADSEMCQQLDNGQVISAEDHTHTLQPPNSPAN